eukprot:gb/GEZN01008898.1/.p1 GENE.gb/GEZN01008898.1/~~gb/GEZN01008898.1/.p1  ORF type:complete len:302 (-),score=38.93 gb/GEZN01008898.1/:405-1310(-)
MDRIYYEKQVASLCAVHSINNLLQGAYFTGADFGNIAHQIDEHERQLMLAGGEDSEDFLRYMAKDSTHVDESGNFSIEVIKTALKNMSITCQYLSDEALKSEHKFEPVNEQAFICNFNNHWITLRRMGPPSGRRWFNLDSTLQNGPELISDLYLSLYLHQLIQENYSIFLVRGQFPCAQIRGSGQWFRFDEVVRRASKGVQVSTRQRARNMPLESSKDDELQRALALSLSPTAQTLAESQTLSATRLDHGPQRMDVAESEEDDEEDEELSAALILSMQNSIQHDISNQPVVKISLSTRQPE